MERMVQTLRRLRDDDRGVTALEYGLMAGLIALLIAGAVMGFGAKFKTMLMYLATSMGAT